MTGQESGPQTPGPEGPALASGPPAAGLLVPGDLTGPTASPLPHLDGELNMAASPYPPIAGYAFLSDCEVTALIAPSGSVEWTCLPRMDTTSVFGAILDRDAGRFRFGPSDMAEPADR